jgi:uncharacterized protein DUF6455
MRSIFGFLSSRAKSDRRIEMPSPFMFSDAAIMFSRDLAARRRVRHGGEQFELLVKMHGVDLAQLNPTVLREARHRCAECARRKACRRWLRSGEFKYSGDPRCPNADLLWSTAPQQPAGVPGEDKRA